MRVRCLLTFSIVLTVQAQQTPADLLLLARSKVEETLNRLPRYMCTQTIDRDTYDPEGTAKLNPCDSGSARTATRLKTSDRLRLDVAIAATAEMYSWVGEQSFYDRDLIDLVREGAISNGNFATLLTAIFRTDEASFTYNGDISESGRQLAEFGFRVPYERSHYRFVQRPHLFITGYDGTLLVDAKTGDLMRLVVQTNRLPSETGVCYATTTMDYGRLHLNDSATLLLPTEVRLHILSTDGTESKNHTVFSDCHQFIGESTLSFDPAPAGAGSDNLASASRPLRIPPGLPFRVALTQGIDTANAAAGDSIRAKLTTPIKKDSKVLVPAGTPIVGRITRMEYFYADSSVALNITLGTVNLEGASMPLSAVPDTGRRFRKQDKETLRSRVVLGTLRSLEDRSAAFVFRNVPQRYLIASGLESMWVTGTQPTPGSQ